MPGGSLNAALKTYVGANARRLRERVELTQEVLAARVGVSPRYLREIELGKVNLTLVTLGLLADALGVQAHRLLRPATIERRGRGRPKKRVKRAP